MIGMTGSTGFIGSYVLSVLLDQPRTPVKVLVRNSAAVALRPGLDVLQGDLLSREDCEAFIEGLDVIYYLAHHNSPVNSDADQATDTILNLVPLLNLLHAIRRSRSRPHIVYMSSGGAVYGVSPHRTAFSETDSCNPTCSYGVQKLAAEHYLRIAAESGYLTATILRVGNAYGTLLPEHRRQGFIGVAATTILNRKPVRIFGNLENVRDYVHLDDICSIALKAALPKSEFCIVNVGSGKGHSVREVLSLMQDACPWPITVIEAPVEHARLTNWVVLNISKAEREFGWRPRIELNEGIGRLLSSAGVPRQSYGGN